MNWYLIFLAGWIGGAVTQHVMYIFRVGPYRRPKISIYSHLGGKFNQGERQ